MSKMIAWIGTGALALVAMPMGIQAQDSEDLIDPEAVEILQQWSDYKDALDGPRRVTTWDTIEASWMTFFLSLFQASVALYVRDEYMLHSQRTVSAKTSRSLNR